MDADLPYLTPDLPGTGGRIREELTDFVVEELPLYEASGAGEHLYVTIQKTGISTHEAVRRIARELAVPPKAVGYAGLKDARGVARQTLSVQGAREEDAYGLEIPGVEVLEARRHRNKLRLGHLRGNRFLLRVRGVDEGAEDRARAVLDRLAAVGAPNLFGAQRFGSTGDSWKVGRAFVRRDPDAAVTALLSGADRERDARLAEARRRYEAGDLEGALRLFPRSFQAERRVLEALVRDQPPERAVRRIPRGVARLQVSAYQSWLFNRIVAERMPDLGALEDGDLAFLHDRGAVFLVEDAAAEQPRAEALEISPSAPLFGRKVLLAEGEPGRRERAVIEEERLDREDFRLSGMRFDGERRPVRVPLGQAGVRPDGEGAILLSFTLPRGSYATTVLREVMKEGEPDLPE